MTTGHRGCPGPDGPGDRQGGGRQHRSGVQPRRRRPDAGVRAGRGTGVAALYPPPRRPDARATPRITRRCSPSGRARWPLRPPACISLRICWRHWKQPACMRVTVTLHVGIGTFLPVRVDRVDRPSHARRARRNHRRDGGSDQPGATRRRPRGRGRHHQPAAAGKRRAAGWHDPAVPAARRRCSSCPATGSRRWTGW